LGLFVASVVLLCWSVVVLVWLVFGCFVFHCGSSAVVLVFIPGDLFDVLLSCLFLWFSFALVSLSRVEFSELCRMEFSELSQVELINH